MSWLKLTSGYLYLMKGGTNQHIDYAKIETSTQDGKVERRIKEFPHRWFTSAVQRPKTIIVNLNEETIDSDPTLEKFSKNQILKIFEVPISFKFFEELKKSKKISELIKIFDNLVGGFTDKFFTYQSSSGKSYEVLTPLITFSGDDTIKGFPVINFNPSDPDFDTEEPSFSDILLWIVWNSGLTVKPDWLTNPAEDSKVRIELKFIKPEFSSSSSQPVRLRTLERALEPNTFNVSDEGIDEIIKLLQKKWQIAVNISSGFAERSKDQNISISFLEEQVTFTRAVDALSRRFGGVWGWEGDSAFLKLAQES